MPDAVAESELDGLRSEIAGLIVESLELEDVAPEEIDPHEPLFGDGLGLDSIDALEIAFVIAKRYGIKLSSSDERNKAIFASLDNLARHVAENRRK